MRINKLSIIIPAFNEEQNIESILRKIEKVDFGGVQKEVIIVDDGSKDGTRQILKNYEDKYKIIYHLKNLGKGAAVRSGFKEASGDYAIIQDADLEYDPEDIKKMIRKAEEENADVVYGSRRLGAETKKNPKAGWHYHLAGKFLTILANLLYGIHITDEPTCYKMVSRGVLDKITLKARGFEFCPEITAKIGRLKFPIFEVPISYSPRSVKEGKKIKLKDGIIAAWTLVKYRFWKIT